MNNQLPGQPERRGPGRPPRIPVQIPLQPVPIAPRPDVRRQDNAHLEEQGQHSHSQNFGPPTPNALASTSSAPTSTGHAQQENPVPYSLICVGTTEQQPLATLLFYHSPLEYKTDISIMHGNGSLQNLPNMALVSRRWPDQCFIAARWLELLELPAIRFPDNKPRPVETPHGTILAYRQVAMWFSFPHLQYGPVLLQAIVLDDFGVGVAAIFGGSWVDLIFNGGNWRSGGASAMGFIRSYGP